MLSPNPNPVHSKSNCSTFLNYASKPINESKKFGQFFAMVLLYYADKVAKVPSAAIGAGKANFDGSHNRAHTNLLEVEERRDGASSVNYSLDTSILSENSNNTDAQKEIMLQEIRKKLEEIKKQEDELRKDEMKIVGDTIASTRSEVNELEKENSNAIIGRIITSLVAPGIFDILDIFSIALDHFSLDFVTGIKDVVSDEKVVGPIGKAVDKLGIDEIFGFLADKTPVLSDVNKSFVQLANSELMSPFASIFGSFLDSQVANYMLRIAFITHRIGQEIDLDNKYKGQDEKIKNTINSLNSCIDKKNNEIIEKIAPRIIELEISSKLKNIYYQAFLGDRSVNLNDIFKKDLLDSIIRVENGQESNVQQFLEKIRNRNDDIEINKMVKNPQNRDIMKQILDAIKDNYQNKQEVKLQKIDMLKNFFEGDENEKNLKLMNLVNSDKFANFMEKNPETLAFLKTKNKDDLFNEIVNLGGDQTEAVMIAITKTQKLDQKILDMKTTISNQSPSWTKRVSDERRGQDTVVGPLNML